MKDLLGFRINKRKNEGFRREICKKSFVFNSTQRLDERNFCYGRVRNLSRRNVQGDIVVFPHLKDDSLVIYFGMDEKEKIKRIIDITNFDQSFFSCAVMLSNFSIPRRNSGFSKTFDLFESHLL